MRGTVVRWFLMAAAAAVMAAAAAVGVEFDGYLTGLAGCDGRFRPFGGGAAAGGADGLQNDGFGDGIFEFKNVADRGALAHFAKVVFGLRKPGHDVVFGRREGGVAQGRGDCFLSLNIAHWTLHIGHYVIYKFKK